MLNSNTKYSQKKIFLFVVPAVVFLFMLVLNFFTPFTRDDYRYMFHFGTGEKITGVLDIFSSQYVHYFTINGRAVTHFLAQLFLFLPRFVFVVLNAAAYTALGFLIYVHMSYGKQKSPYLLGYIYIGMWFLLPAFGETVLWTDGASNYLWGTIIVLSYLLPLRMYAVREGVLKTKLAIPLMLLMGVIAGWCNENTSGMAIFFTIIMLLMYKCSHKKIPLWSISGLIGLLIGFVCGIPMGRFINNPSAQFFSTNNPLLLWIAALLLLYAVLFLQIISLTIQC